MVYWSSRSSLQPPTIEGLRGAVRDAGDAVVCCAEDWAGSDGKVAFRDVETQIRDLTARLRAWQTTINDPLELPDLVS